MRMALFQREARGLAVVGVLTGWFLLLTAVGPLLQANGVQERQVTVALKDGSQYQSKWVRRNGSWQFERMEQMQTSAKAPAKRLAAAEQDGDAIVTGSIRPSVVDLTRPSLVGREQRWARLNGRGLWQAEQQQPEVTASAPRADASDSLQKAPQEHHSQPASSQRKQPMVGRWVKIAGVWTWRRTESNTAENLRLVRKNGIWTWTNEASAPTITAAVEADKKLERRQQMVGEWIKQDGIWTWRRDRVVMPKRNPARKKQSKAASNSGALKPYVEIVGSWKRVDGDWVWSKSADKRTQESVEQITHEDFEPRLVRQDGRWVMATFI